MRHLISTLCVLLMYLQAAAQTSTTNPSQIRLVIIGDSTACDYPDSHTNRGWGQYIEEHFKPDSVRVINLAASGRSTKTFIQEGRWQKALDEHPNYVLIQFGHNDSHAPTNPEATDFAGDYKQYLRRYVDESRAISATPILITPMVRRTFDANGKIVEAQGANRPLASYALAMKDVAKEKNVALIDLFTSSKALAERIGPQASAEMNARPTDSTHFNEKGARAMADLVLKDLAMVEPKLAAQLRAP